MLPSGDWRSDSFRAKPRISERIPASVASTPQIFSSIPAESLQNPCIALSKLWRIFESWGGFVPPSVNLLNSRESPERIPPPPPKDRPRSLRIPGSAATMLTNADVSLTCQKEKEMLASWRIRRIGGIWGGIPRIPRIQRWWRWQQLHQCWSDNDSIVEVPQLTHHKESLQENPFKRIPLKESLGKNPWKDGANIID